MKIIGMSNPPVEAFHEERRDGVSDLSWNLSRQVFSLSSLKWRVHYVFTA
jgi:hypothetical protein